MATTKPLNTGFNLCRTAAARARVSHHGLSTIGHCDDDLNYDLFSAAAISIYGQTRALPLSSTTCSARTSVRMWHCQSVSVVCVPSLSVVQPLDCWSDPMALVALTLWGPGASRRRQSLPDDLHGCQSCPGDSEQLAWESLPASQGAARAADARRGRIDVDMLPSALTLNPRESGAWLRAASRRRSATSRLQSTVPPHRKDCW